MTIWFTSDTHFFHNKNFVYEPRGFTSVEEMNEEIVKRWNEKVGPNDIIYLLGDIICLYVHQIPFAGRVNI